MAIHIIIDGYNLIRQCASLSELDRIDIQSGREALIDMLAAYKKVKRHKITVVFDGINAPSFSPHQDRVKGILVKFSHNGESADTVIKRMAQREKEKALIVSSDLDIVDFAASKGAATINSLSFEEKLNIASYYDMKGIESEDDKAWIPTTRKKGPKKRLSKRKRRNRIKTKKL